MEADGGHPESGVCPAVDVHHPRTGDFLAAAEARNNYCFTGINGGRLSSLPG